MNTDLLLYWLEEVKNTMAQKKDYLIQLDSIVGDGDLGLTMSDGFASAYEAALEKADTKDVGIILYNAGKRMSQAVPSTMGTLMAFGLMQAGKSLRGISQMESAECIKVFEQYAEGVEKLGKAKEGEKTFLDGLLPAIRNMKKAQAKGKGLNEIAKEAAIGAKKGFDNATKMRAVHGRAASRGEDSIKLEDPGAAVAMLLMQAFETAVNRIAAKY